MKAARVVCLGCKHVINGWETSRDTVARLLADQISQFDLSEKIFQFQSCSWLDFVLSCASVPSVPSVSGWSPLGSQERLVRWQRSHASPRPGWSHQEDGEANYLSTADQSWELTSPPQPLLLITNQTKYNSNRAPALATLNTADF